MKLAPLTLIIAAGIGGQAAAQQYESSSLGLEFYRYGEDSNYNSTFATAFGNTSYLITPQFGGQIGIAGSAQIARSDSFTDLGTEYALSLHGYYDLSPVARLGLLFGADTYDDGDTLLAFEGIYLADGFRFEGRAGRFSSDVEPATLIEARVDAAVSGPFGAQASFQRITYDDNNGFFSVAAIGATYDVTSSITGYARLGTTTNDFGGGGSFDGTQITIGGKMALGGATNDRLFTYNPFF